MIRSFRHLIYALTLAAAFVLPRRRKRHFRLTILKLDKLGDGVLSLGAVRCLLHEFGDKQTLLIVSTVAEPLFRAEFPAVELLVLPPFCERYFPDLPLFLWRHAASLRSISTEALVCLRHQPSDYLHVIARLIAPNQCHTCDWDRGGDRVSLTFPRGQCVPYPQAAEGGCLEVEAHRRVVESVIGEPVSLQAVTPTLLAVGPTAGHSLVVCPLAGSEIRWYPPPLLAAALHELLKQRPMPVVFCLPPEADDEPWRTALAAVGLESVEWLRPPTLVALIHSIAEAGVVLAPDSAPAHLATALDKPGVFLLGGGEFGMFAPWTKSARQVWLYQAMPCYQCRWKCIQPEPYCITQIRPVEVASELVRVAALGGR